MPIMMVHHGLSQPTGRVSGVLLNQSVNQLAYGLPVGAHFVDRRPIIMSCIQVIPTHLIDANREYRLHPGVDALRNQSCQSNNLLV